MGRNNFYFGSIFLVLSGLSGINSFFVNDPADDPVLYSGIAGVPPLIMDPNIHSNQEGLHLFYSTYFCLKPDGTYYYSWDPTNDAACSLDGYISGLGYAFSSDDGFTWQYRAEPIFSPGGLEWEQYKVETAFVLENSTHLHLFYCAIGYQNGELLDNRYQVGVSTFNLNDRTIKESLLNTNLMFERTHADPLIPFDTETSSFFNNVQEPSAVFKDNKYEVYFLGLQFSKPTESADAAGQEIQLIGLGVAHFDLSFNLLNITTEPLPNTKWNVNIPEVRYADGQYTLVAASMGDGGYVHHSEYIQVSYSDNGYTWTSPEVVLSPPGGEAFNGWASSSPTLLLRSSSPSILYYSSFMADYTTNNGYCDYSVRYGIGVPDPYACIYITIGRAYETSE